jgi:1-acyl-sn-glycerol-3-phosphate acyltransferase
VRGANRGERLLYGFVRAALVGFGRVFFRIDVEGLEHVPSEGPFILSPIHRSNIDFLVVLVCARRRMRYMAKDTLWKPGWGRLFTALGGFPVHRGSADREALRTSIQVIESGEPLVMFPEGTRQTGPKLAPMFDGPAYVQSRTGVPIVPVGIGGTETVMPKGAKMIRPHKVVVVVGEPLPAPVTEGSKARRSSIKAQTAKLGEEIQRLFDRAQELAGTPNR